MSYNIKFLVKFRLKLTKKAEISEILLKKKKLIQGWPRKGPTYYWILTFKKYYLNYKIFTEFYLKNSNMTKNNNFFRVEPGISSKIPNINNLDFSFKFQVKKD
jgi:hypothetical protein